jgi:hypothetical protein
MDAVEPEDPAFEIANEYARVVVRRRYTRNGMRLEIASPRLESSIMLDAVLLESLTWQTDEIMSRFLSTPFQAAEPIPPENQEDQSS